MVPLLALTLIAQAHKPTFSGDFDGPDTAFAVEDPEISIVVYQEITCDTDQLWFAFDGTAGFPLYIQLGVPVVDRLADYRPSVALLAPGLDAPSEPLPFAVPDGLGAVVFHSDTVDVPDDFHEPFTNTWSWVVVEETVVLPEDGTGYLVAWDPEGWTGKLWLATGTIEDFSDVEFTEFLYWSEAVNDFHETGRYARVDPREEAACDTEPTEPAASQDAPAGCTVSPLSGGAGVGIAFGLAIARRRDGN